MANQGESGTVRLLFGVFVSRYGPRLGITLSRCSNGAARATPAVAVPRAGVLRCAGYPATSPRHYPGTLTGLVGFWGDLRTGAPVAAWAQLLALSGLMGLRTFATAQVAAASLPNAVGRCP